MNIHKWKNNHASLFLYAHISTEMSAQIKITLESMRSSPQDLIPMISLHVMNEEFWSFNVQISHHITCKTIKELNEIFENTSALFKKECICEVTLFVTGNSSMIHVHKV